MSIQNWSMTVAGYPAHTRSGVRVVGVTHMSTYAALSVAQAMGLDRGWLFAEGSLPQLAGLRAGACTQLRLSETLAAGLVVQTEGLANGSLVFAGASPEPGEPLSGRSLIAWAEARNQPWVEVIDNEIAYWGGLDDARVGKLLAWFLCQRPFVGDWRKLVFEPRALGRLRHGLFEHGWTRNLGLVRSDRQDLWAGVHQACALEHSRLSLPSKVGSGVRVTLSLGEFTLREIPERCPINDETGKARLLSGEL